MPSSPSSSSPQESNDTRHTHWAVRGAAAVARLVVAGTFIVAGFAKLDDPWGVAYKLYDYAVALGVAASLTPTLLLLPALVLAVCEFCLGIYLFFGIRRNFTTFALVAVMAVMTPLTLWVAVAEPVHECGCFGAMVPLTGWQSFGKNVVLTMMVVLLCVRRKAMTRLVSEGTQLIVSAYSIVWAVVLWGYCFVNLPVIDFRPYRIGADVRQILTFAACDMNTDEDVTDTLLNDTGYVALLVMHDIATARESRAFYINTIYDYATQHGVRMVALTGTMDKAALERWRDMNGAEYPILWSDADELKTMVRSNPGLVLLHDGRVVAKRSNAGIPLVEQDDAHIAQVMDMTVGAEESKTPKAMRLLMIYVLPLMVITSLDRLYALLKWLLGLILKRKRKDTNNNTQPKHTQDMRKKIVAGNWKMNMNLQEGVALSTELKAALAADAPACDVVICTPFMHLAKVNDVVEGTVIGLGAENCADKEKGAYTGEVSAAMVKSTGAQYVILGHSERRAYYGETAEILKEKVNLALANGLKVIFCIGEVKEEREAGTQNQVVGAQLAGSLYDLTAEQMGNIILAYEPVWAIGTGLTATSDQAEDMHAFIRGEIAKQFGAEVAENISILYGGSCKPSNAKEIFSKPDVDGGLIGGAALKVADFKGIIDAWK